MDSFTQRFENLVRDGKELVAHAYKRYDEDWVDNSKFCGWKASAKTAIQSLPVANQSYLSTFDEVVISNTLSDTQQGLGILEALLNDINSGYLENIEDQITSNTFVNILEAATEYLNEGYKDPAGVLAGVALEDSIRRMGQKYLADYKDTFKFGTINQKLSKALPYNDAKRGEIDSWYKIRDFANHAKWDDFDEGQVKGMIECVNKLIADYL